MKAYKVTANDAEGSVLVFAPNRDKARVLAQTTDLLCDIDYIDLKVTREPKIDCHSTSAEEILDEHEKRSDQLMYELGWICIDAPFCMWCGRGEFPSIPESRVKDREHDFEGTTITDAVCEDCWTRKGGEE
ncbi:MAG: hypothetical protein O2931_08370 [Planctomycetota bacterium]|nr:hypothetical protein [Planctomycetota bacterium]